MSVVACVSDAVCLRTLEVLSGMICQTVCRSVCTLSAPSHDCSIISLYLVRTQTNIRITVRKDTCGGGSRKEESLCMQHTIGDHTVHPVRIAAQIARVSGIYAPLLRTPSNGSDDVPYSKLCSLIRRYDVYEMLVALAGRTASRVNQLSHTLYEFGTCYVAVSSHKIEVSCNVSSCKITVDLCNSVRIVDGKLWHEFDHIASNEFFRVLRMLSSTATTIRITQARI